METKHKSRSKVLPIIITICITLVLIAGVGGWTYVQNQQVAQKDRELQQQKQLKEKEFETQKEAAKIQAEGQRDAAACQKAGSSWFSC